MVYPFSSDLFNSVVLDAFNLFYYLINPMNFHNGTDASKAKILQAAYATDILIV